MKKILLLSGYGCKAVSGTFFFGNGHCNAVLNTPECKYDGGDCCLAEPHGSDHNDHHFGQLPCKENREELGFPKLPFNMENIGNNVMDTKRQFKTGSLLGAQEYCKFLTVFL